MTDLEAVNQILSAGHEAPVQSLSGISPTSAEGIAQTALARASNKIQLSGWLFNTTFNETLSPDGSGNISMANVLSFELLTYTPYDTKVTIRNGQLYDLVNKTAVFSSDVQFKRIVRLVPFAELPATAQDYIVEMASRDFVGRTLGSQALREYSREEEYMARARFLQDPVVNEIRNFMDSDPDLQEQNFRY